MPNPIPGASVTASPTPTATPTHIPSGLEQEHIKQALDASQTAIDAIAAVVSISTWALGIIGVGVALIAFWGWASLKEAARETAKQIANDRFSDYIKTDEFKELVKERIAKSVDERWGNAFVVTRLAEEPREPNDPSPFPSPGDAK